MKKKYLCTCGKLATWFYAPVSKHYGFYCEDCVPRGCECNYDYPVWNNESMQDLIAQYDKKGQKWKFVDDKMAIAPLDVKGREYPCVEFFQREDGWEVEGVIDWIRMYIHILYEVFKEKIKCRRKDGLTITAK